MFVKGSSTTWFGNFGMKTHSYKNWEPYDDYITSWSSDSAYKCQHPGKRTELDGKQWTVAIGVGLHDEVVKRI